MLVTKQRNIKGRRERRDKGTCHKGSCAQITSKLMHWNIIVIQLRVYKTSRKEKSISRKENRSFKT